MLGATTDICESASTQPPDNRPAPRPSSPQPPTRARAYARGRRRLGADGERFVVDYLQRQGYTILARNWQCPDGELDIVAYNGVHIVFCEVKTRASTRFGAPVFAIDPAKVRKVRTTALRWLAATRLNERPIRFDVFSVLTHPQHGLYLEHRTDAF